MSATDARFTTADGARPYDEIRKDWHDLNIKPLWENVLAHKVRTSGPPPLFWQWSKVRPLIDDAMKVTTPAAVERRVLTLTDPDAIGGPGSTCTNLTAGFQILLPGKSARPHRHTMNALRFVIEGGGASTVVDGKDCPMEEGDLVITPGWTWHEHVHKGDAPIIWLDALDAPLHRYLGTDVFEPGPEYDLPSLPDDAAFAIPNLVPELTGRHARLLASVPLSLGGRFGGRESRAALARRHATRALRQSGDRRTDHADDGLLSVADR